MKKKKLRKIETIAAHAGLKPEENHGIVNPPVYHASTILSPSMKNYKDRSKKKYTYGRNGTPTSEALEKAISDLYDADGCVLAPSGMSAITNSFMGVLKSFDHALIPDCVYGSARRFVEEEFKRFQIEHDFYDSRDLSNLESKIKKNTKIIYLESPGSYTFEIIDINKVVKLAKKFKITTIIDNTWGTALYFNALKFGVDIVVEAITKYIGGHSDVMMGVTVCNKKHLNSINRWKRNSGQCVGPDDIFLALRGLRTLPLRLKQSQENSIKLAHFLTNQKEVKKVYHPALKEHPDHKLWKRDFSGACGIFGIEFEDYITTKMAEFFADNCLLFGKGASWGGYESLMTMTDVKSNRTINTSYVPKGEYLRIYVGIENIEDILDDVRDAFTKMRKKFK
ncbi:MAG: cystathionine beta-lyase [Alphaproteobacteria bacterium]|nr:MAG: cystathionine beta-lyase [Alphaproteobacteria bacterium]